MGQARAIRQLTVNNPKSAGRNSAGRITIFHRGGGAKRLYRKIDTKRNTPSMGIVERIEYDPNRSCKIAAVRWVEGAQLNRSTKCATEPQAPPPPRKVLDCSTTSALPPFLLSSLTRQRNVESFSKKPMADHVMVGLPTAAANGAKKNANVSFATNNFVVAKKNSVRDVFLNAFGGTGSANSATFSSSNFPRIAVAGAKPLYYAPRLREGFVVEEGKEGVDCSSPAEIKKWTKDSSVWAGRIKRKSAVSWMRGESLGQQVVRAGSADERNVVVEKADGEGLESQRDEKGGNVQRTTVTYILASHGLDVGKMVMNCDVPKSSSSS